MHSLAGPRLGFAGAMLAAAAWFASGVVAFAMLGATGGLRDLEEPVGETTEWLLIEALHAAAELGMLIALIALAAPQSARYGRGGRIGFVAAFAGTAVVLLSTVLALALREGNVFVGLLFGLGLLGWVIGFPLLGTATVRTRLFPGWVGWLLMAFPPLLVVLFLVLDVYGIGGVVVGALWLALGMAIRRDGRTAGAPR
jgi:hypothetical protein